MSYVVTVSDNTEYVSISPVKSIGKSNLRGLAQVTRGKAALPGEASGAGVRPAWAAAAPSVSPRKYITRVTDS